MVLVDTESQLSPCASKEVHSVSHPLAGVDEDNMPWGRPSR